MDEPRADPVPGTPRTTETGVLRRRKRTTPRPDEIQLLTRCSSGPRALPDGPVGRCTKYGWLRPVIETTSERASKVTVRYELTEAGRTAIDAVAGWI